MSNGYRCCAVGVCCAAPAADATAQEFSDWRLARKAALATMVLEGDDSLDQDQADKVADYLLDQVGFVPVGVDAAIARAYRPLFEEALG